MNWACRAGSMCHFGIGWRDYLARRTLHLEKMPSVWNFDNLNLLQLSSSSWSAHNYQQWYRIICIATINIFTIIINININISSILGRNKQTKNNNRPLLLRPSDTPPPHHNISFCFPMQTILSPPFPILSETRNLHGEKYKQQIHLVQVWRGWIFGYEGQEYSRNRRKCINGGG